MFPKVNLCQRGDDNVMRFVSLHLDTFFFSDIMRYLTKYFKTIALCEDRDFFRNLLNIIQYMTGFVELFSAIPTMCVRRLVWHKKLGKKNYRSYKYETEIRPSKIFPNE